VTQPGRYDFVLEQGSTFRLTFIWKIGDTPVDVSNFQARLQIREHISDADPVLAISDVDDITVGTTDGAFEIVITDEETAVLDYHSPAFYDFEVESTGGEVTRLLHGRAGLSREVTRELAS
jgi:hypothetical protein